MFIKSLIIENFKGFHDQQTINFNMPDGKTEGSGLNIFVGENNSGKSTILEALDLIKDGTKKDIKTLLSKSNPNTVSNHLFIEVTYQGDISNIFDAHLQENKVNTFKANLYSDNGKECFKVKRSCDLNNPDNIKKIYFWNNEDNDYCNPSGIDAPFKKLYDNNFIWADTNPNDETKFGASTLCGSLLKEIALGHVKTSEYQTFQQSFHDMFNNPASQLRAKIAQIEKKAESIFASQFGAANISFSFDELSIDNFFKTANLIIDDGVAVPMTEKGHGMQRALALSLLQVYADITANVLNNPISKPFYLYIDEPEICLHPSGQKKLLDALMVISKTKQIFITTHSPFMLSSPKLKNVGLFIYKKENNRNTVTRADTAPLFPWSPSWGEISYKAYNLPTVELHNELYGLLQNRSRINNQNSFDEWLQSKGITKSKDWKKELSGKVKAPEKVTLPTFIRNHIHHPENEIMQSHKYTEDELKESIKFMISILT